MAHHNFDTPEDLKRMFNELAPQPPFGATGRYPMGTYSENDEGEIRFGVAADKRNKKVLVDFGKPVHSLGMTPEQALELAASLKAKAESCLTE